MSLDPSSVLSGIFKVCLLIYEAVGRANVNKARCVLLRDRIRVIETALRSYVSQRGVSKDGSLEGFLRPNDNKQIVPIECSPQRAVAFVLNVNHAACVGLANALQCALNLVIEQSRCSKAFAVLKSCAFSAELDVINKRLSECANDFQISLVVDAAAEHNALKGDLAALDESLHIISDKLDTQSTILAELLKLAKGSDDAPTTQQQSFALPEKQMLLGLADKGNNEETTTISAPSVENNSNEIPRSLLLPTTQVKDGRRIECFHCDGTINNQPTTFNKNSDISHCSTKRCETVLSFASLLLSSSNGRQPSKNLPTPQKIFSLRKTEVYKTSVQQEEAYILKSSLRGRINILARGLTECIIVENDLSKNGSCLLGGNSSLDFWNAHLCCVTESPETIVVDRISPSTREMPTSSSATELCEKEYIPTIGILLAEIGSMQRLKDFLEGHKYTGWLSAYLKQGGVVDGQLAQRLTEMLLLSKATEEEEEDEQEDSKFKIADQKKEDSIGKTHTIGLSKSQNNRYKATLPSLITLVQWCCNPVVTKRPSLHEVRKRLADICGEESSQPLKITKPVPPTAPRSHIDPMCLHAATWKRTATPNQICRSGPASCSLPNDSLASPQGLSPASSQPSSSSFASRTDCNEERQIMRIDSSIIVKIGDEKHDLPPALPTHEQRSSIFDTSDTQEMKIPSDPLYSPHKHMCKDILTGFENKNQSTAPRVSLAGGLKQKSLDNKLHQTKEKGNKCCIVQ